MPKPRKEDRWSSLNYTNGFVFDRNGVAYIRIGASFRASLGVPFVPARRNYCRQILDEAVRWINSGLTPDIRAIKAKIDNMPAPIKEKEGVTTVSDLFKAFASTHFNTMDYTVASRYKRAMVLYLPNSSELYLEDPIAIRNSINKAIREQKTAPNYQRKLLQNLRRIFKYGVAEEYISKDPFTDAMIPKQEDVEYVAFTEEELDKLIDYFSEREPIVSELILFLRITGMRIAEALSVEWSKIDINESIQVKGKGGSWRAIPILPGGELSRQLNRLKIYELSNEGYLFPWRHYVTIGNTIRDAMKSEELNFYVPKKGFHAIRRFAETDYVKRGMPERETALMFGHSQVVQRKHYLQLKNFEDLKSKLAKLEKVGQSRDKDKNEKEDLGRSSEEKKA